MKVRTVLLAVTAVLSASCAMMVRQDPRARVEERRLGPIPEDRRFEQVTSHGRHIAWLLQRGSKWIAVVDGVAGPEYDEILPHAQEPGLPMAGEDEQQKRARGVSAPPAKSPADWLSCSGDGRHRAYTARKGTKQVAIIDGREGAAYDEVRMQPFVPDERQVWYQARKGNTWLMIWDGKEGPAYDLQCPWGPLFSDNSERMAYVSRKAGRQVLIVDGKEGTPHDSIDGFTFSPDGNRIAYAARDGDKCSLVVDDKAEPVRNYDSVKSLDFSLDGHRLAMLAVRKDMSVMIVDGEEGREYEEVSAIDLHDLIFSPEGHRFAYKGLRDSKWHIVVDGVEGAEYDEIHDFGFSPDGKHVAYEATKDEKLILVVDGQPIDEHE